MANDIMDITQALKDTENALRDFIATVLHNSLGRQWIEKCGASPDRIKKWEERYTIEQKRQKHAVVENRLLYYSDFYDLRPILKQHWAGQFSDALGDFKTIDVWLKELEKLRDPDAHRRELLPHQKHLIMGITGEIRARLIRYRSKKETSEDYYPRIESARDNLGNINTPGLSDMNREKMRLRVSDCIEFVITATDPMGESLEYATYDGDRTKWQDSNIIRLKITEDHIGVRLLVMLVIKSKRKYHAYTDYDDHTIFEYEVLPRK